MHSYHFIRLYLYLLCFRPDWLQPLNMTGNSSRGFSIKQAQGLFFIDRQAGRTEGLPGDGHFPGAGKFDADRFGVAGGIFAGLYVFADDFDGANDFTLLRQIDRAAVDIVRDVLNQPHPKLRVMRGINGGKSIIIRARPCTSPA